MQLYRPCRKTAYRALQRRFLRLHPLNRPRYQTDTSGYNTTCDTMEGIHAPGRAQISPPRRTLYRPAQLPIIIRYIKGCKGAPCYGSMPASAGLRLPCADRLQVLTRCQQHRPGAPAEGSASPPVPGQRSRRRTLHPAGQSSSRGHGGRRGTIGDLRRISFRAFAR